MKVQGTADRMQFNRSLSSDASYVAFLTAIITLWCCRCFGMVDGTIVITDVRPFDSALVVASSTPDGSAPILNLRARLIDDGDVKNSNVKIEEVKFVVSYDGGAEQTFPAVTSEPNNEYYTYEVTNPDKGEYCYHIEAVNDNNQVIQFPDDGGKICFDLAEPHDLNMGPEHLVDSDQNLQENLNPSLASSEVPVPIEAPTEETMQGPKSMRTETTTSRSLQALTPPPTRAPTMRPTTRAPTRTPTRAPTRIPTRTPTRAPTMRPTTRSPTRTPTRAPTMRPTTRSPTRTPTRAPTMRPTTRSPTRTPTRAPTRIPTRTPTRAPTMSPTGTPTRGPTMRPTGTPTRAPTMRPTLAPTPLSPGLQPDCLLDDPTRFNICFDLKSNTTNTSWFSTYERARDLWESVITGDLGSPVSSVGLDTSDIHVATMYPPLIDDVYIAAVSRYIDGENKILGSAGYRVLRTATLNNTTYKQTLTGFMRFDQDDIARLMTKDPEKFESIVLHEMGHVLGIGTLWVANNLHTPNSDRYRGTKGNAEWNAMGCNASTDFLPIEQNATGGNAHWDELCLGTEVMTPIMNAGAKFSRLTIATLEDMGYTVSYTKATAFTIFDICDNSECKNYCRNAKRNCNTTSRMLRPAPYEKKQKPKLSKEGRDSAIQYAMKLMKKDRGEQSHIFDHIMEVLYEENGEIYEVQVKEDSEGQIHTVVI